MISFSIKTIFLFPTFLNIKRQSKRRSAQEHLAKVARIAIIVANRPLSAFAPLTCYARYDPDISQDRVEVLGRRRVLVDGYETIGMSPWA